MAALDGKRRMGRESVPVMTPLWEPCRGQPNIPVSKMYILESLGYSTKGHGVEWGTSSPLGLATDLWGLLTPHCCCYNICPHAQICPRGSPAASHCRLPISETLLCTVHGRGGSPRHGCGGWNPGREETVQPHTPMPPKYTGARTFAMGAPTLAWHRIQRWTRMLSASLLCVSIKLLLFTSAAAACFTRWCALVVTPLLAKIFMY